MIAIHSDNCLFAEMRQTPVSGASHAEALRDQSRSQATQILSLDSRILTTLP
ncbi:MAG: hypothetical protein AAF408_13345 [Pseudomonadota bacterium]